MARPEMTEALHPQGKGPTRVNTPMYEAFRAALLEVIPTRSSGVALMDLPDLVEPLLPEAIAAQKPSLMWWVTTVKLDLEARGLIERVPGTTAQHLRRLISST